MPKVLRSPAAINEEDAMQQVMQAIGGKPAPAPPEIPPTVVVPPPRDGTSVIIEVSLAEVPPNEFGLHIDTTLTRQQSTIARRIAAYLDKQQACLNNGQRVLTATATIKWLLEQIEKELPAS